ncbi:MAG TPA: hypothetical protein V6C63_21415 [Allocoleopsis sp.]
MIQENFIQWFATVSMFTVSLAGFVASAWAIAFILSKAIDEWLAFFKLKTLFVAFLDWRHSEAGREAKARLIPRTPPKDDPIAHEHNPPTTASQKLDPEGTSSNGRDFFTGCCSS